MSWLNCAWWHYMGQFCHLTGATWKCSGQVFTPFLVSLLQRSSTVFHPNLPVRTKTIVAFGPFSEDVVSALFFRRTFSARRWAATGTAVGVLHSELILLTQGSISPLMPMYLPHPPPQLPFLTQSVLTANRLLWPHVLLLPCVCLHFPVVFVASACCALVYA